MITKEEFEKLAGIELIKEKEGKLICDGNLDLKGRTDITELPENLRVLGYLYLCGSGVTKLPKGLIIGSDLIISKTEIEELPEDTKFGGSLYVNDMKKPFSFPKVVMVNGHFDCSDTTIKRMPEEVYTKWGFNLSGSAFDNYPKVMEFSNSLYLDKTPITELPEGLKKVYGNFGVYNTKISKLNDNLVVYGDLDLGKTLIEYLSEGLIVGDELDLCDTKLKDYSNLHKVCSRFIVNKRKYNEIKDSLIEHSKELIWDNEVLVTFKPNYKGAYLFENENGKYIKVDNIFGKIIERKGNVYYVKVVGDEKITYLATDGEGKWTHR